MANWYAHSSGTLTSVFWTLSQTDPTNPQQWGDMADVDDVYANGNVVEINVFNWTRNKLYSSHISPDIGGFTYPTDTGENEITCDIHAAWSTFSNRTYGLSSNHGSGTLTINGNIYGSSMSGAYYGYGIHHTGAGNLLINGSVYSGNSAPGADSNYCSGIVNAYMGDVYITGEVRAYNSYTSHGVDNKWSGTITVDGNVTAGSNSSCYGIYNSYSNSVLYVGGDVVGGSSYSSCYGIYNNGTSYVTGDVSGGSYSSCSGIYNSSNGVLYITGDVSGGSASDCYGVYNANQAHIEGVVSGGSYYTAVGVYNSSSSGDDCYLKHIAFLENHHGAPPTGGAGFHYDFGTVEYYDEASGTTNILSAKHGHRGSTNIQGKI